MKSVTSAAIFAGFLLLYIVTLRPGVLPADSGEFQLAATQLTIAHPPGFPLYVLVGWLFTRLPGDPAANLNFLSAIFSALTLAMLPWVIAETRHPDESQKNWIPLASILAAVLLGTSTTFWSQATTTNIRSLTTLFAMVGIFCLLRWINFRQDKWLIGAVAVMSFGVTHHLSLAFFAIVMVGVVLWTDWSILRRPKLVGRLALATAAGLLPWLLLPILESTLRDPQAFFIYVTGLGFGNDFFFVESWSDLLIRMRVMWNVLTFQFDWILLLLTFICLASLVFYHKSAGVLLIGCFLILTLIAATYRAPQTVEYMLPAYLSLVIPFGWLLSFPRSAYEELEPNVYPTWTLMLIVTFVAFSGVVQDARQNWASYSWLAGQHDTADYANEIFDHAPANSIVYATWHWFTPLSYMQQVEGERPDLDIIYVDPTFNDDWAGAIAESLADGRPVVATNFNPDTYHVLPPHLPLGEAFLWPNRPVTDLPNSFLPANQTFGDQIELVGVQPIDQTVAMSEATAVTLAWRPVGEPLSQPLKLFIHLVGSDGRIYAQQDLGVTPQSDGLSQTRFVLTPRPGVPLGDAQLLLGAYLADGTQLLDEAGEARTEIGRIEVTGTRWRPVTQQSSNELDEATGMRLVGTDVSRLEVSLAPLQHRVYRHWQLPDGTYWTSVEDVAVEAVPEDKQNSVYVPLGQGIVWHGTPSNRIRDQVDVTHSFTSDRPILRDIGVAVRQVGYEEDQFTWAWLNPDPDNDIPATGAIPTLKWVRGSQVQHPRQLTIPENATAGQTTEGFLRLYDVFTREPVPILDERVTADGRPWIRYGLSQISAEE